MSEQSSDSLPRDDAEVEFGAGTLLPNPTILSSTMIKKKVLTSLTSQKKTTKELFNIISKTKLSQICRTSCPVMNEITKQTSLPSNRLYTLNTEPASLIKNDINIENKKNALETIATPIRRCLPNINNDNSSSTLSSKKLFTSESEKQCNDFGLFLKVLIFF